MRRVRRARRSENRATRSPAISRGRRHDRARHESVGRVGDRRPERISKSYDDREIVRDFSLRVMRRDRIGVVGANGAGKTTLINLLTGALEPDSGSVRLGANVTMATARSAARVARADDDARGCADRRRQRLCDDQRRSAGTSWATCATSCFRPSRLERPIGKLSGGERGAADARHRPSPSHRT